MEIKGPQMVRIKIGRWLLQSDPHCWVVGEYAVRTDEGFEREFARNPKYPSTLENALKHLVDQEMRESEARSLAELLQVKTDFVAEIREALALDPTILESVRAGVQRRVGECEETRRVSELSGVG